MVGPLAAAVVPELGRSALTALTSPIFTIEASGVAARGTPKRPRPGVPWRVALHPSALDVGVGGAAVIAAWALWNWANSPQQGGRGQLPIGLPIGIGGATWNPLTGQVSTPAGNFPIPVPPGPGTLAYVMGPLGHLLYRWLSGT